MSKQSLFVHQIVEIKKSLINVFLKKPIYSFWAILIAGLVFTLFIFLTNIPLFLQAWSVGGIVLLPKVSLNIINTIITVSGKLAIILMAGVSLMAGVNISMILFKLRATKKISGFNFTSVGGIVGSAFGAGCPACSTSLLSILGVTGGLSVLPLKGLEFTTAGLLILLISFYFISKSISMCEECRIK